MRWSAPTTFSFRARSVPGTGHRTQAWAPRVAVSGTDILVTYKTSKDGGDCLAMFGKLDVRATSHVKWGEPIALCGRGEATGAMPVLVVRAGAVSEFVVFVNRKTVAATRKLRAEVADSAESEPSSSPSEDDDVVAQSAGVAVLLSPPSSSGGVPKKRSTSFFPFTDTPVQNLHAVSLDLSDAGASFVVSYKTQPKLVDGAPSTFIETEGTDAAAAGTVSGTATIFQEAVLAFGSYTSSEGAGGLPPLFFDLQTVSMEPAAQKEIPTVVTVVEMRVFVYDVFYNSSIFPVIYLDLFWEGDRGKIRAGTRAHVENMGRTRPETRNVGKIVGQVGCCVRSSPLFLVENVNIFDFCYRVCSWFSPPRSGPHQKIRRSSGTTWAQTRRHG